MKIREIFNLRENAEVGSTTTANIARVDGGEKLKTPIRRRVKPSTVVIKDEEEEELSSNPD